MKILIADDEKIKRVTLANDLTAHGHDVVTASDGAEALGKLQTNGFDVVVADWRMPQVDGMELLQRIKQNGVADAEVIIMTAYGGIPLAVEAGKYGAFAFLTKPFRNEELLPLLARIEKVRPKPRSGSAATNAGPGEIDETLVGHSPAMRGVRRMIEICARSDANVLLCGETGVGKDLIASLIHRHSRRRSSPFIKVGCTLFPSQLIESELYGHEKGSFTGAEQQRLGRFELAEGGSLYLDDVDDIPIDQQAKLLRAIEEKILERLGGGAPIKADVRIIASTKLNLLERISAGAFRQDLYYRLDVLRVNIPPLRQRRDDIPLVTEHLLKRIAKDRPARIDPDAAEVLESHSWPGNVRELLHLLQRVYLIGSGTITGKLLAAEIDDAAQKRRVPAGDFQTTIAQTERELLENALHAAGGIKTAAASALGMKPTTFRDKLAKYGLG